MFCHAASLPRAVGWAFRRPDARMELSRARAQPVQSSKGFVDFCFVGVEGGVAKGFVDSNGLVDSKGFVDSKGLVGVGVVDLTGREVNDAVVDGALGPSGIGPVLYWSSSNFILSPLNTVAITHSSGIPSKYTPS